MELLIALVIIVAVVFAIVKARKLFRPEIDRAKRIRRANENGK